MPGFGKLGARGGFGSLGVLGKAGTTPTVPVADLTNYQKGNWTLFLNPYNAAGFGLTGSDSAVVQPANFPNGTVCTWSWTPSRTPGAPIGFNQLAIYGDYFNTVALTPIISAQVNGITTLSTAFNFAHTGPANSHVVCFDWFLTDAPNAHTAGHHKCEIQVYLTAPTYIQNYVNACGSGIAGAQLGTVTISGIVFKVARDDTANSGAYPDFLFMPNDLADHLSGTLDKNAIHAWLISQSQITGTWYYNGDAFGVEPTTDNGTLTLNSISTIYIPWFDTASNVDVDFANNRAYVAGTGIVAPSTLLSLTRAGSETVTDASGNLTTAGSGALALSSAGLQVYGGGTNLLLQSQSFQTTWTTQHITVTDNTATAPDGTATASTWTADGTSNLHLVQQALTFASNTYVVSLYVKQGTARYLQIAIGGSGNGGWINFDTQTGAVFAGQNGVGVAQGTGTFLGAQALANGWYRIAWKFRSNSSSTSVALEMVNALTAARSPTTTTSGTLFVWGAQLEIGNTVTPYIVTTTATASRLADNISLTGALATALASAIGTVSLTVSSAVSGIAATFLDANGMTLLGKNAFEGVGTAVGAALSSFSAVNWNNASNKMSLAWNAGGGSLQLGGDTPKTDVTARSPTGTFYLGSTGGASNFFGGNATRLTVYPTKQALTATAATPFRSFNTLTAYGSNPIIPFNTNAANTVAGDTVYPNLANKIGSTYYSLSQANNGASLTSWRNFNLYTSTDLVNWTLHPSSPVISFSAGTWKDNYIGHPAVLNIGGTWYAYYTGRNAAGTLENVGVATSPDFVTWADYGSNPVITDNVGIPWVIQIGSTLHLYVANRVLSSHSISHYTSPVASPFGPWTKIADAITTDATDWFSGNGRLNDPCVVLNPQGFYEMTFTVENFAGPTTYTNQATGYAVSLDGITWTKLGCPILLGSSGGGIGGAPNNKYPGDPVLLINGATVSVYWAGANASGISTGCLATIT